MAYLPARPFVSFCLATFNRGGGGRVALDCLEKTWAAAQTALGSKHFDIRLIDNASTDGSAELLGAWAAEKRPVTLHRLTHNCGPVAKNIALHDNPADILVLLDDDAYPQPGALAQMIRHFQDDPHLGAAVFDVTLPDGRKEASAYPDVFIGAGTALRGDALRATSAAARHLPGRGYLPADFFMQAEEYDLSFRLLQAGWSVQRFWDMPLCHLKTPGARIGTRTTRLDVRNNLWLLARYLPAPLCHELAADWLARYWQMAIQRDGLSPSSPVASGHRSAYLRGAAEGLTHWDAQRRMGRRLSPETIEHIFKFDAIRRRLAQARQRFGLERIVLAEWSKNLLAYHAAAASLNLEILGILDDALAASELPASDYRGTPLLTSAAFRRDFENQTDAIVLTQMSRVHAQRSAGGLRRSSNVPVIDLFDPGARAPRSALQPVG